MRIIDYDLIDEWSPWLEEILTEIAGEALLISARNAQPEYIEDARDFLVREIGLVRLVDHFNNRLAPYVARVYHGTRVTETELLRIKTAGLTSLILRNRRNALIEIFSQHPEWLGKEALLDQLIEKFGIGARVGRREDGCVHVCLSRTGLLHGCNHYLKWGAEVDHHIAHALFPDGSGLELLKRNRTAKLVAFTLPFPDAAAAANPYGFPKDSVPTLIDRLLSAWAYRLAHPRFTVVSQRDDIALRIKGTIDPQRLDIEEIPDSIFTKH